VKEISDWVHSPPTAQMPEINALEAVLRVKQRLRLRGDSRGECTVVVATRDPSSSTHLHDDRKQQQRPDKHIPLRPGVDISTIQGQQRRPHGAAYMGARYGDALETLKIVGPFACRDSWTWAFLQRSGTLAKPLRLSLTTAMPQP
jgi:hypothetical protein